jgi:putative intracellular protease/amidase
MSRKILFITTSCTRLGDTGRQTGIWAEELALPYLAFKDAGYQVDIASPQGGMAPLDPGSLKPAGQNPALLERFLADAEAQRLVRVTQPVSAVDAVAYDAVFFPGGHGAMWDLPQDPHVQRLVEQAFAAGQVIGAVCHGVAGLVAARSADGRPLVAGRRVNSFTNDEEAAAGLTSVVPFLLETRLRELGGQFQKAANWASFAVQDGTLITGQNPASSARVAELMLQSLGAMRVQAA